MVLVEKIEQVIQTALKDAGYDTFGIAVSGNQQSAELSVTVMEKQNIQQRETVPCR